MFFQIKGFEGRLMLAFALLLRIRLILHFISVYIEMKITPFLMIPKRSLNKFQKHAIEYFYFLTFTFLYAKGCLA